MLQVLLSDPQQFDTVVCTGRTVACAGRHQKCSYFPLPFCTFLKHQRQDQMPLLVIELQGGGYVYLLHPWETSLLEHTTCCCWSGPPAPKKK